MKFSVTGQEKGDRLIEVATWAGLTIFHSVYQYDKTNYTKNVL